MKKYYIFLGLLFLSHSLSAMLVVRNPALVKQSAQSHISKRTLIDNSVGCKCIHNFKGAPEKADSPFVAIGRTYTFKEAQHWINKKAELEIKGLWPKDEGAALEKEFYSKKYCPQLNCCLEKCNTNSSRLHITQLALQISLGVGLMMYADTNTGIGNMIGIATICSTFYECPPVKKYTKYYDILMHIAYQDMRTFEPIYLRFIQALSKKAKIHRSEKE